MGDAKPARSYDGYLAAALNDIQAYWSEEYPALFGEDFRPLSGGIYAAYPERTDPIPPCGGSENATTYQEVSDYGAFYCGEGDFMAYDDGPNGILAQLAQTYSPSVVAVVLAHEFGHAIQARTGDIDRGVPTVYTEQQADCFSGAWSAHAWRGEAPGVAFDDEDVRTAMIALVSVRDPLGQSVYDQGGHGSAFDRIGAFETGFIGSAEKCKNLIDRPLPLLPNEFKPGSNETYNEGNAPFGFGSDQIVGLVQSDLNEFWPAELSALGYGAMPTLTVARGHRSRHRQLRRGVGTQEGRRRLLCGDQAGARRRRPGTHALRRLRRLRRRLRRRAGMGRSGAAGDGQHAHR